MNGDSVERRISITSRSADGSVTHVTHTSVHVSMEEHFDPETCCDERERALIAAMRAIYVPNRRRSAYWNVFVPRSTIVAVNRKTRGIDCESAGLLMLCGVIHAGRDQAFGRLP